MKLLGCIMVKNEEERILVTLETVKDHIDELVVHDTGSTDGTLAKIADFCATQGLKCNLIQSEFVDFSTSRNQMLDFAETLCSADDFLLLLDCNDELRVEKEIKGELAKVPEDITGIMGYSYWQFSVEKNILAHIKFLIIRAHRAVRYRARVHEFLVQNSEPYRTYYYIEGTSLYQNRDFDDAKTQQRYERDLQLLMQDYKSGNLKGRSLFYIAKTYTTKGDWDAAIPFLKKRANMFEGDIEENYSSFMYLALIYSKRCVYPEKVDDLQMEQNKPNYRRTIKYALAAYNIMQRIDPLIILSEHYIQKQKWRLASIYTYMACHTEVPKHAHSFDYKKYKFTSHMNHAIVSFNVKDFKEGLAAVEKMNEFTGELNPDEIMRKTKIMEAYSMIPYMFVDTGTKKMNAPSDALMEAPCKTAEKPKILFACGAYWHKWDGETVRSKNGIGGSELVAITMAEYLATKGWDVYFTCDCEKRKEYNGVKYFPLSEYILFLDENIVHTLIVYRIANLIKYTNVLNVLLSVEDVSFAGNLSIKQDIFKYMLCKSDWQLKLHEQHHPQLTPFLRVLGNGIHLERFDQAKPQKEKGRFIYTSDPTRGLNHLMRMFPKIRKFIPHATLHVFFDIEITDYRDRKPMVMELYNKLKKMKGVVMHPRVSQDELAVEIQKSEYWLYPTEFTETYCISALEMQAGRVHCIYRKLAGLESTVGERGIAVDFDPTNTSNDIHYLNAIKEVERGKFNKLDEAEAWARTQTWDAIGEQLDNMIKTF